MMTMFILACIICISFVLMINCFGVAIALYYLRKFITRTQDLEYAYDALNRKVDSLNTVREPTFREFFKKSKNKNEHKDLNGSILFG